MNNEQGYLKNLGEKLALVLAHEKVENASKHAIEDIILHAQTEANDFFVTHPALVATAFPLIINGLGEDYGTAVCHSLEAIYNSIEGEFDGLPKFRERKSKAIYSDELSTIVAQLSGIMENPFLPENVSSVIAGVVKHLSKKLKEKGEKQK